VLVRQSVASHVEKKTGARHQGGAQKPEVCRSGQPFLWAQRRARHPGRWAGTRGVALLPKQWPSGWARGRGESMLRSCQRLDCQHTSYVPMKMPQGPRLPGWLSCGAGTATCRSTPTRRWVSKPQG